jgi:hypothetical protein
MSIFHNLRQKYDGKLQLHEVLPIVLVTVFCALPLFVNLPFKINLFLAWEGSYRMAIGQIPFRDFYLPMGFGFWIIPAIFFKLFGPSLYSLLVAQAVINFLGAMAFRGILKHLGLNQLQLFVSLLVYCLSFILVNFWPWYNHSVFIFQLIATFLIIKFSKETKTKKRLLLLLASSFFVVLSFFTKQDGGGLALLNVSALLAYTVWVDKQWRWLAYYCFFLIVAALIFVLPFISNDFLYWFNYGQAPHNARTNLNDILVDVFEGSHWIKFYLLAFVILVAHRWQSQENYVYKKNEMTLNILILGILMQAMLVQVTSYIPHNVNIYFHSFAIAFFSYHLLPPSFNTIKGWATLAFLVCFWWSSDYWRYGQRIVTRMIPSLANSKQSADKISKYTWLSEEKGPPKEPIRWTESPYQTFRHVLLPEGTIEGMKQLLKMPQAKIPGVRVLNMSELTPLAAEMGFEPLKNHPLWFHRNVSIFEQQIDELCGNIADGEYDIVLFEHIPYLNQFYPARVRESLQKYYKKVNSFVAPREKEGAFIEVYVKP